MRDDFLFNSDDRKQRGHGCDRMGTRRDGLRFLWRWIATRDDGRPLDAPRRPLRVPCQICEATLPRMTTLREGNPYVELVVIFWHTEYEARLEITGDHVYSERGFKSRLAAQRAAERFPDRLATAIRRSVREASS